MKFDYRCRKNFRIGQFSHGQNSSKFKWSQNLKQRLDLTKVSLKVKTYKAGIASQKEFGCNQC